MSARSTLGAWVIACLIGIGSAACAPPSAGGSQAPVESTAAAAAATAADGSAVGGPTDVGAGASQAPDVSIGAASVIPAFEHVYVIVMENKEYGSIVGSSRAPYTNSLIRRYGLATNYHAITHPSEPNYLALFSGSTQGIRDDGLHSFSGKHLADQLDARGRTWRVFAENVPPSCYAAATASGGEDGAGTYARKHEPAISFSDISRYRSRCAKITDFTHFSPTAANFELIVPNMCHDTHDCSIRTGDTWLSKFVPRITASPAFANSVLFITWDEGTTASNGGGHIATIVVSPHTPAGLRSAKAHSHYSLLHTIELAWGLGCLNRTCTANDLHEFFTP